MPSNILSDQALLKAGFTQEEIDQGKKVATLPGAGMPVNPSEAGKRSVMYPRDIVAEAVRYVPPIATALISKSPTITAAVAAGSEGLARNLDPYTRDEPVLETAANAVGSGISSFLGDKYLGPVMARALHKIGQPLRWLYGKSVLGPMTTEQKILFDTLDELGTSPSPARISKNSLTNTLEGLSRAALIGGKSFEKLDDAGFEAVRGAVSDYINAYATVTWNPPITDSTGTLNKILERRWGNLLSRAVFDEDTFVSALLKRHYDEVRSIVKDHGYTGRTNALLDTMSANKENRFYRQVFARIRPYINKSVSTADDETILDIDDIVGDTDPQAMAEALAEIPQEVPVENIMEARRILNSFLGKRTPPGLKNAAGSLKDALDPQLNEALDAIPGARQAFSRANALHVDISTRLRGEVMNDIRKNLAKFPSTVPNYLIGGGGRPLDRLLALEEAFTSGDYGTTRLSRADFDNLILRPIRQQILYDAFDKRSRVVTGQALSSSLDKYGQEYAEKVFGSEAYREMKNYASTLQQLELPAGKNRMIMALAQGGALTGATVTAFRGGEGLGSEYKKGVLSGLFAITMGPAVFSRIASNPERIRTLIKGHKAGPGTEAFSRMMGMFSMLAEKERFGGRGEEENPQAYSFYNDPYYDEPKPQVPVQPTQPQYNPLLM